MRTLSSIICSKRIVTFPVCCPMTLDWYNPATSWTPGSLSGLLQRFLDATPTYYASALASLPIITPEETGTLAIPRSGRCHLYDGTDDYSTLGARVTSGNVSALTVTAWINTAATNRTIAGEYNSTGSLRIWRMIVTSTGKLGVLLSADGGTVNCKNYSGATSINDGAWHHVAFVYSSGTLALYVDGAAETLTKSIDGTVGSLFDTVVAFIAGADGAGLASKWSGKLRDIRVYNIAKSVPELNAIRNQASTPNTLDRTGLLAGYWCEEEAGTTVYDWTGNGKHLTATNVTVATFQATDSGVLYSAANELGHTLSGSTVIPRNEANITQDVAGASLGNAGPRKLPATFEVPCITGDGLTSDVRLGAALLPASAAFDVSFWFYATSGVSGVDSIFSQGTSGLTLYRDNDTQLNLYQYFSGATLLATVSMTANTWNYVTLSRSGSTWTLTCTPAGGSTSTATGTLAGSLGGTDTWFLNNVNGSTQYAIGRIADVRVTTGGITKYIPLQEGPGSDNTNRTIYWVADDGTSGAVPGAIVGGTVSSIWANRCPYVRDHGTDYGLRVASGVAIPGRIGAGLGTAADGNALTHPAGKRGNANARTLGNYWSVPALNAIKMPTRFEELPCFTSDGTGYAVLETGSTFDFLQADSISIECWYKGTSNGKVVLGNAAQSPLVGWFLQTAVSTGYAQFYWYVNSSNYRFCTSTISITDGNWHHITITKSGASISVTVDGTTVSTSSTTGSPDVNITYGTSDVIVLAYGASGAIQASSQSSGAQVSDIRITKNGVTWYFPLTDGIGPTGTNRDLGWYKSDDTSGVVSSAVVGGTLSSIWANVTDGTVPHDHKYALPCIVPRNTKFSRIASNGRDRYFTTRSSLSGTDLTNALTYEA